MIAVGPGCRSQRYEISPRPLALLGRNRFQVFILMKGLNDWKHVTGDKNHHSRLRTVGHTSGQELGSLQASSKTPCGCVASPSDSVVFVNQ